MKLIPLICIVLFSAFMITSVHDYIMPSFAKIAQRTSFSDYAPSAGRQRSEEQPKHWPVNVRVPRGKLVCKERVSGRAPYFRCNYSCYQNDVFISSGSAETVKAFDYDSAKVLCRKKAKDAEAYRSM